MPKGKEKAEREEEIPWQDRVAGSWCRGTETPSPLWGTPDHSLGIMCQSSVCLSPACTLPLAAR